MKQFKKLSALFLLCAAILCGCTQSNIVSPTGGVVEGPAVPDVETKDDVEIDWDEVNQAMRDEFMEPYGPFGDYVMEMAVTYDASSKTVTVLLPVTAKTTGEIAVEYGEAVLKVLGYELATQDFSYAPSDEEKLYYGGFFDENNVKIQIFPFNSQDDESTYLVNDTIKAGEQRALTALK